MDTQTHTRESGYRGHPFRVSVSTYHQGSAQFSSTTKKAFFLALERQKRLKNVYTFSAKTVIRIKKYEYAVLHIIPRTSHYRLKTTCKDK